MSRAFVKGDDTDLPDVSLPERPLGEPPYYVSAAGLVQLRQRMVALQAEHAALKTQGADLDKPRLLTVERDLRYVSARLDGAVMVDASAGPSDRVRFGARVATCDAQGRQARYLIVGEDEADLALEKISYLSPLARALIGARLGDRVTWQRPAGVLELDITAVEYNVEASQ